MEHLKEKTIKSEKLFTGRVIDLYFEEVELPNGKTSTREIIKHPGAVAVVAITDEGKIVMVRQYRKAMDRILVEIPAGKLENGEKPEVTAIRELQEETGYTCDGVTPLISFYTSPGFADELVHLFVANGLKKDNQKHSLDEDEFVDLVEVTLNEALQMMESKEIYDAKTAYAIQYLQLQQMRK
ncbi:MULTISPECIES: NUDIX hydrolase [Sutcliffiella]|uniref:NUDIX hydrolase n=1 Tax=Sutcliffiella TaxID=2837511 RepID=UPI0022DD7274|nr:MULTISPECIES: NUDIX hydrolase [Sutcliffiella]MED4017206.1 NUDIX hydrolase [Sutcliffiella cohnii]WBL13563.1 NUDIX hydrolase [Sutcliffiella sp. NC1]